MIVHLSVQSVTITSRVYVTTLFYRNIHLIHRDDSLLLITKQTRHLPRTPVGLTLYEKSPCIVCLY